MVLQVKTLKPLSTLKLQQLINLMEEESFADQEYIASEGEMGEKFFIIVMGNVRTVSHESHCSTRNCFFFRGLPLVLKATNTPDQARGVSRDRPSTASYV